MYVKYMFVCFNQRDTVDGHSHQRLSDQDHSLSYLSALLYLLAHDATRCIDCVQKRTYGTSALANIAYWYFENEWTQEIALHIPSEAEGVSFTQLHIEQAESVSWLRKVQTGQLLTIGSRSDEKRKPSQKQAISPFSPRSLCCHSSVNFPANAFHRKNVFRGPSHEIIESEGAQTMWIRVLWNIKGLNVGNTTQWTCILPVVEFLLKNGSIFTV